MGVGKLSESTESKRLAGDLEAIAKEVAAAAHLYRTMISGQVSLVVGMTYLVERLNAVYVAFLQAHVDAEKK